MTTKRTNWRGGSYGNEMVLTDGTNTTPRKERRKAERKAKKLAMRGGK